MHIRRFIRMHLPGTLVPLVIAAALIDGIETFHLIRHSTFRMGTGGE
jgi:hypothetical protein